MCVAGEHDDRLNPVTAHFVVKHLVGSFLTHLYQSVTLHDYELLPLAVVPVLPLGDTGPGDIDADLTALWCVDKFSETASVIAIHLKVKHGFLLGKIREIRGVKTLGEAVGRYLGYHQCRGHFRKLMQEVHNLAERDMKRHRHRTVTVKTVCNGTSNPERNKSESFNLKL